MDISTHIYEPKLRSDSDDASYSTPQRYAGVRIASYLQNCMEFIKVTFVDLPNDPFAPTTATPDDILRILLSSEFNYQSRGRVSHLLPDLRERVASVIKSGRPLHMFLLYHGGYRARTRPGLSALQFEPDQTELLLLYQIARLQRKVARIYPPGIKFAIVINNGVAEYSNDISIADTESYSNRLKRLIEASGAGDVIYPLVQSSLGSFAETMRAVEIQPWETIDPVNHQIVERFLGRECTSEEACSRIARYRRAEEVWGMEVQAIVDRVSGLYFRQIAHPSCLSFRPFPGGAIRVQNGAVGFRLGEAEIKPTLITSVSHMHAKVVEAPIAPAAIEGLRAEANEARV